MSTETFTDEKVLLSTDYKTTLPKQARQFLDAEVGDEISFKIRQNGEVVVDKVEE